MTPLGTSEDQPLRDLPRAHRRIAQIDVVETHGLQSDRVESAVADAVER